MTKHHEIISNTDKKKVHLETNYILKAKDVMDSKFEIKAKKTA